MQLHQIKNFLNIKRNSYQNQEKTHRMGENLYQLFNRKWINIHNTQRAQKTNKRPNNSINKWANELNRKFSEEKYKCLLNTGGSVQYPQP
jgi:hypothetical protein